MFLGGYSIWRRFNILLSIKAVPTLMGIDFVLKSFSFINTSFSILVEPVLIEKDY